MTLQVSADHPAKVPVQPHAAPADAVLAYTQSHVEGLSADEIASRRRDHGPNVLARGRSAGPLELLWRQINSPLIWVLIASGVVAIAVDWHGEGLKNGLVILAVVTINSIIGFVQEYKAGKAIEALSQMIPEIVTVVRGGHRQSVDAAELVPGDIVLLASGDRVPADLRLLAVRNLKVEEAALTGESVAVEKNIHPVDEDADIGDRTSMAYCGTLVTYGTGTGVVTATGARTELGNISAMLEATTDLETPMTAALASIGKYITIGIVAIALFMLVVGVSRSMITTGSGLWEAVRDVLILAIALTVGAIPEGLPAIVTIAMAVGVQRMARRHAIVRKLPAVETLGSTTVICSDKTGTLTRNQMTVQTLWTPQGEYSVTGVGYNPTGVLRQGDRDVPLAPDHVIELVVAATLCNDAGLRRSDEGAWQITGDPTEGALVVAAEKLGQSTTQLRKSHPRLDVIPFESEHQFMATLHPWSDGKNRIIVKGAPEVLFPRCLDIDSDRLHATVEALASSGKRVLAIAVKSVPESKHAIQTEDVAGGLRLVGLQAMIDPPREEVIDAVAACRSAGITVKMITGDHLSTAAAIGDKLGILTDGGAVTGHALAHMTDAEIEAAADRSNVFARVAPEHKLRLVNALQRRGHIVAMTGDGVNDTPTLKQANIGIAMGITGSAAAKQTADIVLVDDNFASIAAAVDEGRRVYDNLIKSLAFVLPTNIGLALIFLAAVAVFPFDPDSGNLLLPLTPVQLLWINLVSVVALSLPLAFEAREPDTMKRPPRKPGAPVLGRFLLIRTTVVALLMTAGTLGLFLWEYYDGQRLGLTAEASLAQAQSIAVTTIILFQCFYVLNCRSLRDSILRIGVFTNPCIFIGIASLLLLHALLLYTPMMRQIFGTVPLDAWALAKAALVGATVLPLVAISKSVHRSYDPQT